MKKIALILSLAMLLVTSITNVCAQENRTAGGGPFIYKVKLETVPAISTITLVISIVTLIATLAILYTVFKVINKIKK